MQSINKNSTEMKELTRNKGESKSDSVENMLDFNALTYDMYPDLSVAVDRTMKTSYPQKSSYNFGSSMQINLNSGSDFINGRTSYFVFDLKYTSDTGGVSLTPPTDDINDEEKSEPWYEWGDAGSAYNVIQDILITDRSGNEIERIKDVNFLANHLIRATRTSDYMQKNGTTICQDKTKDGRPYLAAPGITTRWILPLRHMAGLFDYDQLLPSQLMSGLRIEIQLSSLDKACVVFAGTPGYKNATLTIENPRLMLDSVKLTDSIMRELNRRAARTGLEIMFRTWHTDTKVLLNQTSVNVESRKAVSRAFGAICKITNAISNDPLSEALDDTQASVDFPWTEYQWRAGNLYYPNQKLSGTNRQLAMETFKHVQSFYHKDSTTQQDNALSFYDFFYSDVEAIPGNSGTTCPPNSTVGVQSPISNTSKQGCVVVDLERTTVQDLSGIPLNNSRVLALTGVIDQPDSWNLRLYLNYLKVARVFMENTEIEE